MTGALLGPLCAMGAMLCFSLNDALVKGLSDDYALHQVVLTRSVIAITLLVVLILPLTDGLRAMRTQRFGLHMVRALCVVVANLAFFTALAAMEIAEAVAIFFVSPFLITAFGVLFLGEHVGWRRWASIAVGFGGVVIILRPGTEAFQPAALLPIFAAACYAGLHMLTRVLGRTEAATTMAFYIQVCFIVVAGLSGLFVGHGRFDVFDDPSISFALRAWHWPAQSDWAVMALIGVLTAFAGTLISQAYRVGEASRIAPFEYIALPLSIFYGWLLFSEVPDPATWLGIALILGAGLYMLRRDALAGVPKGQARR